MIGRRQPEKQGEDGRFESESHQEHHRQGGDQSMLKGGQNHRQVSHIEGASYTIKRSDRRQEDG